MNEKKKRAGNFNVLEIRIDPAKVCIG